MSGKEEKTEGGAVTESQQQMPPEEPLPAIEDVVTREVVEAIVAGYDDKLELSDYTAELGTKAGDNYMSIMYSVTIDMKVKSSGVFTNQIHVMLKTLPRNVLRQQMINECSAFLKEIKMYEEVFIDFINFQESKGLTEDEIFRGFPDCYATVHNGTTDFLALKNLRIEKYGMGNRVSGLNQEHVELALKNLAKYHAISFAMFQGDAEKMMEKYPYLEEKMFVSPEKVQEPYKVFMSQSFKLQADLLRKESLNEEAVLVDGIYDESFFAQMHDLAGPKVKWPVINHGDCWTNNMLFKYDKVTKKPTAFKFLDFQMARVASRAVDLGYFFHTSPSIDILNKNEIDFLRVYHNSFVDFISRLGVSPQQYDLTFENLLKEYDEFRFYGVTMGFMMAPMLSADSSDVPDMDEISEELMSAEKTEEFFSGMLKSSMALKKITNLSQNHLPRCKGFAKRGPNV